jgi:hypothetical protein
MLEIAIPLVLIPSIDGIFDLPRFSLVVYACPQRPRETEPLKSAGHFEHLRNNDNHFPGFRESNCLRMRSAGTIIRISTFVPETRTRTLASLSSFNHRGFGFDILSS